MKLKRNEVELKQWRVGDPGTGEESRNMKNEEEKREGERGKGKKKKEN